MAISQTDHLRPRDAVALIFLDVQHDVQSAAPSCCTSCHPKTQCVMSFVCESEKSEMKVCLSRRTIRKAHLSLFNGTVDPPGPVTFRHKCREIQCAAEIQWKSCCECAVHESAEKCVWHGVFLHTPLRSCHCSFNITLSVS